MPQGAGLYDDECTVIRGVTNGDLVAVAVVNDNKGTGMSVHCKVEINREAVALIFEESLMTIKKTADERYPLKRGVKFRKQS